MQPDEVVESVIIARPPAEYWPVSQLVGVDRANAHVDRDPWRVQHDADTI